jgi:hypothetical protein
MDDEEDPVIIPRKIASYISVDEELLMDMGIIPDTRPILPPPSIRTRFRWWRAQQRERLGQWAYVKISGEEFPEREDW